MSVQCYASSTSVVPGGTLRIHSASDTPVPATYDLTFECLSIPEGDPRFVKDARRITVESVTPTFEWEHFSGAGLNWKYQDFAIPAEWPSGLYRASINAASANRTGHEPNLLFVVKPGPTAKRADILCSIPFSTWYAYSPWFGKSIYPYNSCDQTPGGVVSLNRPLAGWNDVFKRDGTCDEACVNAISKASDAEYWFDIREEWFITWLAKQDLAVDFCSNLDLHTDDNLLAPYQLLLSIGHDEYWSRKMRNVVEKFVAFGGNLAVFGANTSWFEIEYDDVKRTMSCPKKSVPSDFSIRGGDPAAPFTYDNWIARPESSMIGAAFRQGAYNEWDKESQTFDYTVLASDHWVFARTGLDKNSKFGADTMIVGYETNAFCPQIGPRTFYSLAEATIPAEAPWHALDVKSGVGRATMGMFRPVAHDDFYNSSHHRARVPGTVFNVGTTDWGRGLAAGNHAVTTITMNVITTLTRRPDVADRAAGLTPVYQYLSAVDFGNITTDCRFYYSPDLDEPTQTGWNNDGVAFFALEKRVPESGPLLQYYRVVDGIWYYRFATDPGQVGNDWTCVDTRGTGYFVFPADSPAWTAIFEFRSADGLRFAYSADKNLELPGMEPHEPPRFYARGTM